MRISRALRTSRALLFSQERRSRRLSFRSADRLAATHPAACAPALRKAAMRWLTVDIIEASLKSHRASDHIALRRGGMWRPRAMLDALRTGVARGHGWRIAAAGWFALAIFDASSASAPPAADRIAGPLARDATADRAETSRGIAVRTAEAGNAAPREAAAEKARP